MYINLILLGIIVLINFSLGVLAFINNPRNKNLKIFFLFIIFLVTWIIANYFSDITKDYFWVIFWLRLTFIAPVLFATVLLYFGLIFPAEKLRISSRYLLGISSLIVSILVFSNLIIKDVVIKESGVDVVFGYLGAVYLLYFVGILVAALIVLLKKYFKSKDLEKKQLKTFILGLFLFLFGATVTNLIIPFIWGLFEPSKYGPYFSVIFTTLAFYAITKHHLFKVKIIATEIFAVILSIISFAQIFIYESWQGRFLGTILFIFVTFFSYLLIRSVLKEVKSKEQIERLNKELSRKNEYLDELLKQKSEFLHVTSHQLKTPISIIRGYLSMIIDGDYKGTKKDEAIIKVMQATNRLSDTVRDFLDASDLEGETIYFKLEPVNIHDILKETISDKQILIKNKNLQIIMAEPHEEIPLVSTSKDRIIDVFSNLIDNAVYYTPKGSITISFIKKGKSVIVEIKDTGIGISKEESAKLFEKFSRSSRSKLLRPDGSGLGLFIARKIVINCGGKIWFHSDGQGTGTSFFVELPIYNDKKI